MKGEELPTLTRGEVSLTEGAAIQAGGKTVENTGADEVAVPSDGKISLAANQSVTVTDKGGYN